MHFNDLVNYERSNFSNHFNIVAGDFINNSYYRGNSELNGKIKINGVGVLGNHEIFLDENNKMNLKKEIKSNYKNSINQIKNMFPNIKILNDEILYKDGYAIIGMTLFYDIKNETRTLFAKESLGKSFNDDNYINRAEKLLSKVSINTPIIFVTHTPFKEYSVSTNKNIGVPSSKIFKKYPNVKIYIHGHGHSKSNKKMIDGILCVSNPIVSNNTISEISFTREELFDVLVLSNENKIDINF